MINRLSAVRKLMNSAKADAYLVMKPQNVFYLSGLQATESSMLITKRSANLIVDSRYYLKAKKSSKLNISLLEGRFEEFLAKEVQKRKIKRLAIESNYLTYKKAKAIEDKASVKIIGADGWVEKVRQKKTSKEMVKIRKAARIADKTMAYAKHSLSLGITEVEVAKKIECFIRKNDARGESFETIVASGPNSSMPHHSSGLRHIKPGDTVVIDLGVRVDGYVSDITRTFLIEPVTVATKQLYETCLEAQKRSLSKVKTKEKLADIDKEARVLIDKSYPSKFKHNLGHGIGLEVHEHPVLGPKSKELLAEDTVFTIEPGIYLDGKAGVRIEDMVQAKNGRGQVLTKSPKNIEDVIIEL